MHENPKEEVLFRKEIHLENPRIANIVCDEQHVYCADLTGKVRMYRLSDGVMERELNPGPEEERLYDFHCKMALKKDLLALTGRVGPVLSMIPTLIVWITRTSSTGEVVFKCDAPQSTVLAMEVVTINKIAIVQGSGDSWRHRSLVVIEKVDNVWIRKDLAQWQLPGMAATCMASDKDVWVILENDTLRVYKSSDDGKQLTMPVSEYSKWQDMSMSLPFLVTLRAQNPRICVVQVFKVPTDKDIGRDPSLLKSINIEGVGFITSSLKLFYSSLVVGVLYPDRQLETILRVFETAKLLDVSVLPENVEWREAKLGHKLGHKLNTTSLVYIKRDVQGEQHRQSLVKRNFWISNSKSE